MKKNTSLYIVLALVIIIGAVVYFMNKSAVTPEPVTQIPVEAPAPAAATITLQSVSKPDTAAAGLASSRIVKWSTANYPANASVTINLIKLESANPSKFSFVRALATNTANDGEEVFTPAKGEQGDKFYVEVVCAASATFTSGCTTNSQPIKAF